MNITSYQNGNYSVKRNDIIILEGQDTQSINILLQGKLDVLVSTIENHGKHAEAAYSEEEITNSSYKVFSIDKNVFFGANDLLASRKNSFSFKASEDSTVYVFAAQNLEQFETLINSQKDYGAYIITSIAALIEHSYSALLNIQDYTKKLIALTDNLVILFWLLKDNYGFSYSPSVSFFRTGLEHFQAMRSKDFKFPAEFTPAFFEQDHSSLYEEKHTRTLEINDMKADYYKHLSNLPLELRKNFFSADTFVTVYNCKDASKLLNEIQAKLKHSFRAAEECFKRLYCEGDECIFTEYLQALNEVQKSNYARNDILNILEYIIHNIKKIAAVFENTYDRKCDIDTDYIDKLFADAKESPGFSSEKGANLSSDMLEIREGTQNLPEELNNSLEKILMYSDMPRTSAHAFLANLEAFKSLKDKFSSDIDARNIKQALTSSFFEIYEAVFKKVYREKSESRLHNMFLNFAYMDESLLDADYTLKLYELAGRNGTGGLSSFYSMKDWLTKIYDSEKDPSINEFGQDYFETFREMRKRGEVTDNDRIEYENDKNKRLSFEINNMFKTTQKLCHGQISAYFPIIHNEMIMKDPSKSMITPQMMDEGIKRILDVDFSAFHRELSFRNPKKGIEKEFIMKSVLPDFIMMPVFGSRGVMWQELSGKVRSTPGRFILPVFTGENLDDMLLKLVGNFRWELCRTMMGVAWNDITEKSLTSEYTDYIQFYKKNKDLSDEAKEKIKVQIQKCHNKMRDIFTADYETWVNHESKGIIRLNKVARGILYRHCPLSKTIRESLERQPMFSEIGTQFRNTRAKQAREIENHYNKLIRSGISLDPELEENLMFYKEM